MKIGKKLFFKKSEKNLVTSKVEQNSSSCSIGIWNYHLAPSDFKSRIFPCPYASPLWILVLTAAPCTVWIIKFVLQILDYLLRYDTSWLADHGRKKSDIPAKRCHRIFILSHPDFLGFVVQFLCPLFVLSSNIVPIHLSLPQGKASKMGNKPKSKWQIKVRLLFSSLSL